MGRDWTSLPGGPPGTGEDKAWAQASILSPLQAFQEEMAQFREGLDARRVPVSCALVALMAHGGPQGQLLGADGQEVQPEALVQELSRCRALWGCPKIFLLQACRGGEWGLPILSLLKARPGPRLPGLAVHLLQEASSWELHVHCPTS